MKDERCPAVDAIIAQDTFRNNGVADNHRVEFASAMVYNICFETILG